MRQVVRHRARQSSSRAKSSGFHPSVHNPFTTRARPSAASASSICGMRRVHGPRPVKAASVCPLSADEFVVFAVRSNPEPMHTASHRQTECAVVQADTSTVEASVAHRFELQRRVRWIGFQLGEVPVRHRLHVYRQGIKALPKPLRRGVLQRLRAGPARKSSSASAASRSEEHTSELQSL